MTPEILLFIIKLIAGGLVGFFAILLMSKHRSFPWACLVAGFLLSYATLVYDLLIKLGVLTVTKYQVLGIPLPTLLCATLPSLCFIMGFIAMLFKKKGE